MALILTTVMDITSPAYSSHAATMADILFIKTSSLGDVIHHMPAVTEARKRAARRRALPGWWRRPSRRWCGCTRRSTTVVPVAWRRWRKSLAWPATLAEIAGSLRAIRARRYDEIVDSQGLLRSAVIARARARPPPRLRRAPASASRWRRCFYDVRHAVSRELHAVDAQPHPERPGARLHAAGRAGFRARPRALCATPGERYAVLLHATARLAKQWPEADWIALGQRARGARARAGAAVGHRGRARAQRAHRGRAAARAGAGSGRRSMRSRGLIAGAQLVVGVDTGLLHLAAALGVPLVAIFTGSEPASPARSAAGRSRCSAATARRRRSRPSKEAVDRLAG